MALIDCATPKLLSRVVSEAFERSLQRQTSGAPRVPPRAAFLEREEAQGETQLRNARKDKKEWYTHPPRLTSWTSANCFIIANGTHSKRGFKLLRTSFARVTQRKG